MGSNFNTGAGQVGVDLKRGKCRLSVLDINFQMQHYYIWEEKGYL